MARYWLPSFWQETVQGEHIPISGYPLRSSHSPIPSRKSVLLHPLRESDLPGHFRDQLKIRLPVQNQEVCTVRKPVSQNPVVWSALLVFAAQYHLSPLNLHGRDTPPAGVSSWAEERCPDRGTSNPH